MSLSRAVNKVRYNYWVASFAVVFFGLISRAADFANRWIKQKVKVNGKRVRFHGHVITFPKNVGININSKIYWNGEREFEPFTSKALLTLFRYSNYFFDIGSNFGIYSGLAQKMNEQIRVICFEPLPNIYADNLKFHQANGCTRQEVLNIGLSDEAKAVSLFVPEVYFVDSEITSSSLEREFFYNQKFSHKEIIIQTATLDSYMRDELKNQKIVVKIDVEGHESRVLTGGREFFKTYRPFAVVEIERKMANAQQIFIFIESVNYMIYAIDGAGYYQIDSECFMAFTGGRDFLLLPAEMATRIYYSSETFRQLLTN